jgi:hypothetical protein
MQRLHMASTDERVETLQRQQIIPRAVNLLGPNAHYLLF